MRPSKLCLFKQLESFEYVGKFLRIGWRYFSLADASRDKNERYQIDIGTSFRPHARHWAECLRFKSQGAEFLLCIHLGCVCRCLCGRVRKLPIGTVPQGVCPSCDREEGVERSAGCREGAVRGSRWPYSMVFGAPHGSGQGKFILFFASLKNFVLIFSLSCLWRNPIFCVWHLARHVGFLTRFFNFEAKESPSPFVG
jgi:hypothetical protein